ncbi:MAG: NAD(P)-dependent oxidoreductase [Roseobacter sp.]
MDGRVLVTGATGFLGKAVLRRLGPTCVGQGRNPERCAALAKEGLSVVQWGLPNAAPEGLALRGVDAVVHCAALSSPFGRDAVFHAANVLGTQSVLDFARAQNVKRFVFISSPSVYFALRDQVDVSEEVPLPAPFTAYAKSKIAAEKLVRDATDLGPIILRPRGIYGPGDSTLLPRLLKIASARALPRFRGGRARIDLTFVDDVVSAVVSALEAKQDIEGQAFNISGGEVVPVSSIVEMACARAGIVPRWRTMPLVPALVAARVAETLALMRCDPREPLVTRYALGLFAFEQSLDISKARDALGWVPQVRFAEGLERVFDEGAA